MLLDQRGAFEIDDAVAYFNIARLGLRLKTVSAAAQSAMADTARPWALADQETFFDLPERFRARAAALINADADGVAITPSISYGLAIAAANLTVEQDGEILILADQFPSNVYVWRDLAKWTGGRIRTVERPPGEPWTPHILRAMSVRTAIVAVPQVHWIDGGVIDLEAVGAAAREHGAALVLDLTQSIGAMPFDAARVRPDFAAAALYKWGLGPYGLGFLYCAPHRRDGRPIEFNWSTRAQAEDFAGLTGYQDAYAPGARRYDMGQRAQRIPLAMGLAALDQLIAWTPSAVAETLAARNAALAEALAALDFVAEPPSVRAPHYLSVRPLFSAPRDLAGRLARRNVHVSQRGPRLRITGHLHTRDADVARLLDGLKATAR